MLGNNSGLDQLYITNISGQAATIDANAATGATQFWSDRSLNNLTFNNISTASTLGVNGNNTNTALGAVTGSYVTGATTGNVAISGGANAGLVTVTAADALMRAANVSSNNGAQSSTAAGQVNTLGGLTPACGCANLVLHGQQQPHDWYHYSCWSDHHQCFWHNANAQCWHSSR